MRKILAGAAIAVVALSYSTAPQAVSGAMTTTVDLAGSIFHVLLGGIGQVGSGAATTPSGPGCVGTLVQGVCVPPGFEIAPPATVPVTTAKP